MCKGFCAVELLPSPKFHSRLAAGAAAMVVVESKNAVLVPTQTGLAEKFTLGLAKTVTFCTMVSAQLGPEKTKSLI